MIRTRSTKRGARFTIGAAALIACLLLDSCSSGGGQQAGNPLATALREPYGAHSTDTVITALANAGIAVQATELSKAAVTPVTGSAAHLRLTRWQARNLALDAASGGGGVLGGDLDRVVPMPPGAPPFSYLLAAWVSTGPGYGAHLARDLMGRSDWVHAPGLVYPLIVVVLFVSEATEQTAKDVAASPSPSPAVTPAGFAVPAQSASQLALTSSPVARLVSVTDTPCSAVAGFVDQVLNTIFGALRIDPTQFGNGVVGAVGGWLARIWDAAVDLARQALNAIIKQLTAPVINAIRAGIAAVATFTMIASYLRRWRAPVVASPAQTRFAVGSEADITGTFTVTVDRAGEAEQWPPQLVDCASALQVPLPELAATGAPVAWTVTGSAPGLILVASPGPPFTGTLDSNLSAQLGYATGREAKSTGTEIDDQVTVATGIERKELGQLRMLIEGFVLNQVPGVLQPFVNPLLRHYVDLALRTIDSIADITGKQTLVVVHHGPPPPTPSASGSPGPSGSPPSIAACGLLSAAELGAATGEPWIVSGDHPQACNYTDTRANGGGVAVLGVGPCTGLLASARAAGASPQTGVGDVSLFAGSTLYVCKGDRGFQLFIDTFSTVVDPGNTLPLEQQLARGIVAKL